MDGLRLRRPVHELAGEVARRGGKWDADGAANRFRAEFPGGHVYRVVFSERTGLSREVTLIGPWPSDREDLTFEAIRRWGPWSEIGGGNTWKGADGVRLFVTDGYRNGKPAMATEMRLLDAKE